jgi:hypothetical protein
MLLVKAIKLLPHYYRYPRDVWFLLITIIFGYLYGIIKYYALLTLTEVYILLVIKVIKLIRVRPLKKVARIWGTDLDSREYQTGRINILVE